MIPSETSQSDEPSRQAALAKSTNELACHLEHSSRVSESESARTPPRPCSVRRTMEPPTLEPELEPLRHTPKMKLASESCRSVSDIPTDKTQTKNHFTNSPGLLTPRYAQSLSYASSTSPASLASSDLRTHLSSPSSCSTRYFPEDWLERHEQKRESNESEWRRDDQSPVLSLSEYVTAPSTPEQGCMELEDDVEDMRGVPGISTSKRTGSRVEWSEPSPKRQHRGNQDQTSFVASLLRASTAVMDVPVRPLPGGDSGPCVCEHPEYACINCGQRPGIKVSNARSAAGQPRSSRAPSTMTTTAFPVPSELLFASASTSSSRARSGTSASAIPHSVRTRSGSSSSRLHGGGHTPIMDPSETRAHTRPQSARIQESLGTVKLAEAGRGVVGAEPVVHDVSFDPRSPIQRGTSIPVGYVVLFVLICAAKRRCSRVCRLCRTSGSAVRPSPAMAPVPMGSLGLLFPS